MSPALLLTANAAFQIIFASVLGFYMLIPMQPWGRKLAPRVNAKALLAAHLDWIMLAFMQFGAAFAMKSWPQTAAMGPAALLVFGGWVNPTPYLFRGMGINAFVLAGPPKQFLAASVAGVSSLAILVAWIWLVALLLA